MFEFYLGNFLHSSGFAKSYSRFKFSTGFIVTIRLICKEIVNNIVMTNSVPVRTNGNPVIGMLYLKAVVNPMGIKT